MKIKNVSKFLVAGKDLYWISKEGFLYRNQEFISKVVSYAKMIYTNNVLYVVEGKLLETVPENAKLDFDKGIDNIQKDIVLFYSGIYTDRTYGIAQINDKKQVEILLETKKAEIFTKYNDTILGTNETDIVALNFHDEILWQFPLSSLGGTQYEPDETDKVNKILGIVHGNLWIYTNFGRLVALNIDTGEVVKVFSYLEEDKALGYEVNGGLGRVYLHEDKNIYCMGYNVFTLIDTEKCSIVERYNTVEADPEAMGAYEHIFHPLLQGDYFTFLGEKKGDYHGIGWVGLYDYKARKLVWEYEVIPQEERNDTRNRLVMPSPMRMSGNKLYVKDIQDNLYIFEREE